MRHVQSTPEQRAQVLTASSALWRRLQLATEERAWREEREWARLRGDAEDALEDAPTLVMGRREVPEITAIRKLRRASSKQQTLAAAGYTPVPVPAQLQVRRERQKGARRG